MEARDDDVLELDEVGSFVYCSDSKRWLWTALCRRTLQIIAFVSGDHSAKTCARLWAKIPEEYIHCLPSVISGMPMPKCYPKKLIVW